MAVELRDVIEGERFFLGNGEVVDIVSVFSDEGNALVREVLQTFDEDGDATCDETFGPRKVVDIEDMFYEDPMEVVNDLNNKVRSLNAQISAKEAELSKLSNTIDICGKSAIAKVLNARRIVIFIDGSFSYYDSSKPRNPKKRDSVGIRNIRAELKIEENGRMTHDLCIDYQSSWNKNNKWKEENILWNPTDKEFAEEYSKRARATLEFMKSDKEGVRYLASGVLDGTILLNLIPKEVKSEILSISENHFKLMSKKHTDRYTELNSEYENKIEAIRSHRGDRKL